MLILLISAGVVPIVLVVLLSVGILTWLFPNDSLDSRRKNPH